MCVLRVGGSCAKEIVFVFWILRVCARARVCVCVCALVYTCAYWSSLHLLVHEDVPLSLWRDSLKPIQDKHLFPLSSQVCRIAQT